MRARILSIALLLSAPALAQNVTVVGPVTPGHVPIFSSTTILKDSGAVSPVGVLGPGSSTTNGLALWANTGGTVLEDGVVNTIASNYTWAGAQNYQATNPANNWYGTNQLDVLNIVANYDGNMVLNQGFNQANAVDITLNALHGNYIPNSVTKTTFIGQQFQENFQASGQRVLQTGQINCYGTGDCSLGTWFVTAAQYPRSGDEGVGYGLASRLIQVTPVQLITVTSSSRNTCNTTTTQSITQSPTPQTIGVVSGTGCTVGTWVVVNHEPATAFVNHEAVKITASNSNSITAIFASNQTSGVTITPGVDITYTGAGSVVGEGRVLVDITATPYTTGTVSSISGFTYTGTGTGWSNAMLTGGTAIVPGCVALAADDYTSSPYGAGINALHDWYQIITVTDATHLNILSFSSAGAANYKGKGPGSGGYTVRPCAEVLRIISTGEAILDTNSFAWTNGHQLDISLPPYPDTSGFWWQYGFYSSGATLRSAVFYDNIGARALQTGVGVSVSSGPISNRLAGADLYAYGIGVAIDFANIGLKISPSAASMSAAIVLPGGPTFGPGGGTCAATSIIWANLSSIGMCAPNNMLAINFNASANSFGQLYGNSTGVNGTYILTYTGSIQTPAIAFASGGGSTIATCNASTEGTMQAITDSNSTTVGAVAGGFGTNHVMIRCNGTNWIIASP